MPVEATIENKETKIEASVEVATEASPMGAADLEWQPPMPPTDLIFDDGEPLESNRHRIGINVLIRLLLVAYSDRDDFFAGGNMFIYFSSAQVKNRDFRGPDFFVVLDVDGTRSRQGWVIWEEGGRYPDVIVELLSDSTRKADLSTKKRIYERQFRTPDYFVYDPFDENSLQGWHLGANQRYEALDPNDKGWLWCSRLELWLGIWQGTIDRETAAWLRFYDIDGNLVPLPEEAAQQEAKAAQQEAKAAQQEAEAAQQQSELAQQEAEAERQRAETAQQEAEAERQRAETAQQEAEAERQRAEILAARLRELGIDPNNMP